MPEVNPTYDEVVATLRSQLEEARFQNTLLQLAVAKLTAQLPDEESE